MKTKILKLKTNSLKNLGWLFMLFFMTVGFSSDLIGQRDRTSNSNDRGYEGVRYVNGMLEFENREAFENVYNTLERQIKEASRRDDRENDERPEEEVVDDNSVLAAFERGFIGYKSLRLVELEREFAYLNRGKDPRGFNENDLVIDEVLGAFISKDKTMQIGESIYYLPYQNTGYEITDGSIRTLKQLMNGKPSILFPNVIPTGGTDDPECSASFGANGSSTGLNYSFTFTGTPTPLSNPGATITYHWTFGDGGTSSSMNPSHSYSGPGTYEVCVSVEMMTKDSSHCTSRFCDTIMIEEEEPVDTIPQCLGAALFVWNETGTPGELCFSPLGGVYYNIVSYSWTFGDGNASTGQNPCNTYACDLDNVWVTLTVTLDNGCINSLSLPVSITSNNCCERNAKSSGEHEYQTKKKFTWEQKSSHFLWWFNKIVVKMKHYEHNGNKWKKKKADLKITTYGEVFTEDATGCGCENDYNVAATETDYNSKTLTLKKKISKKYKTRKGQEWGAKYYVGDFNNPKFDTTTTVACD